MPSGRATCGLLVSALIFFIIECNDVVLVDGTRDLPEKVHVRILVIGLCVFEEFVLDVLIDLCPFFGGGQVLQKALKKCFHFYLWKALLERRILQTAKSSPLVRYSPPSLIIL